MSAAEILAELPTLSDAERAQIAEQSLRQLDPELLKLIDRKLRRIAHPEVPEEFWEGLEDMEDGRTADMETALHEDPPPWVLDRTLPRP
jgi:septation ring formation regulator EzrA